MAQHKDVSELFDPIIEKAKFLMEFEPEESQSTISLTSSNSWGPTEDSVKDVVGSEITKAVLTFIQDQELKDLDQLRKLMKTRDLRCEAQACGLNVFSRLPED